MLDGAAGRHLHEVVITAFGPVDHEGDDHERFIQKRAEEGCRTDRAQLGRSGYRKSVQTRPWTWTWRRGCGVVPDRRGSEDLAPARGVIDRVHFVGRAGEGVDLASALAEPERSESGAAPPGGPFLRVLGRFGVGEIHEDDLDADCRHIGEAGDGPDGARVICGSGISYIRTSDAFVESREHLRDLIGRQSQSDLGRGAAAGGEARHEAEVVTPRLRAHQRSGLVNALTMMTEQEASTNS